MDLGIKGKTALVTASSGGMGRNISHALAAEGANVVLFARSEDKLKAVADEIAQQHGVRAVVKAGDMRTANDVTALVEVVKAEFGGLDILVLNTPRPPNPIRETTEEVDMARWDDAYQNQLAGVLQVASQTIPLIAARGWGRVIAITSASVKTPMAHHSLSTVFRAGVTAYMKHLANELGSCGVTVNCVAPALIETPHRAGSAAYSSAQAEARKKLTPLGRMGTQSELAGVVTFLASMQAGFITGATIPVEGGMVGSLF
ncbi:SDR family oxidoreductase [Burkholderia multivorans]|uniref:SDR family oxidoreductase n=1 Tax=Burkholderia multivorans TaxID=87883 RepID=A0AAP2HI73_9BURK|nr:SDR family oxidoreductase [Burkholderia multivorans]MBH9664525.1 SDR family oxidoreductase [Burkholderia multivorans]MBU9356141.1 SDR family oxidoreductase [Burkholderia multivorans]MBU9366588.1 SDR family oxidoreductase [Burkholderia multivorans]MBU9597111.1 SDR family oxidoreductase [Burkholderia multivorans]MBU9651181.1 SDR family oxidoreductase [Burkholderia multivorans]